MLNEKWVYALIYLSVLFPAGVVFGGKSPSYEMVDGLATVNHELDLLVKAGLPGLSTSDCTILLSSQGHYDGHGFIQGHPFRGFSVKKFTEQKEVEGDFIHFFQKILHFYNDIPALRPYLRTFPMTQKEMMFSIQYGPRAHVRYKPPYYGLVKLIPYRSELLFIRYTGTDLDVVYTNKNDSTTISGDQIPDLMTLTEYPVLRKKIGSVQPVTVDKSLKKMAFDRIDFLIYPIMSNLCTTHDLHMSAFRACRLFLKCYVDVDCGFWAQGKELPLAQAKEFTYTFIEDFLDQVRTQKVVEKDRKNSEGRYVDAATTLDWFCFRISFWDKWLNRVDEPYIAQIDCNQGMIHYYAADEGQRLYKVLEEPVPDHFFLSGKNPKTQNIPNT